MNLLCMHFIHASGSYSKTLASLSWYKFFVRYNSKEVQSVFAYISKLSTTLECGSSTVS